MTGDDHGNGGTVGRFNQYKGLSVPGCSVADWQCIRSTSYIYNGTPGMDDATSFGFVRAVNGEPWHWELDPAKAAAARGQGVCTAPNVSN